MSERNAQVKRKRAAPDSYNQVAVKVIVKDNSELAREKHANQGSKL